MELAALQRAWNDLAAKDAMWAVLTGPFAAQRSWDEDAFFATGVAEIESVLERVRQTGVPIELRRALDFGCGPGRLTQALGRHFERVDGVDISETMIARARSLNRLGERCEYHLNPSADLALFGDASFDFVYSMITLQHMEPQYSRLYVEEFFRVTRPGGVIVFQIPSDPVAVRRPRTRSIDPLPAAAAKAAIVPLPPMRCAPRAVLPLRVMVRNAGNSTWPALGEDDRRFAIRLGNHWRSRFGWMLQVDDARQEMAYDLPPGESIEVFITPRAPARPGTYVLEFDMVQEHVSWFARRGSPTTRTRVDVDASLPAGEVQGLAPVIEMHGIPRPEVEALVTRSHGRLLAVDDNDAPGPGWTSFRYVAVRE